MDQLCANRDYGGAQSAKLSCTEQFRAMTFAQLTYRESLRDSGQY